MAEHKGPHDPSAQVVRGSQTRRDEPCRGSSVVARSTASPRSGRSSGPTSSRSTSSARRRSTCSASTAGCATSSTSPTTTPGTAHIHGCSRRRTSRTSSSSPASRSTTTCCATPRCRRYLKRRGGTPMVAMVFFDEETEEICRELGYNLILPPDSLRRRLDSKIVTTQLGNEAGAPSVPNVLGTADTYAELQALADRRRARHRPRGADALRRLGQDHLLHQVRGGLGRQRRGHRRSRAEGDEADQQQGRRRRGVHHPARHDRRAVHDRPDRLPRTHAIQGRLVRQRPVPRGAFGKSPRPAIDHVRKMGDRLAQEGYRGFLEVDVLVDLDTDEVYLGEINPRISGASSMTNVTAGAYADVPLFLFHLLEFMDVDYTVNVEEINDRWRELAAVDVWAQLIMKEPTVRFGRAASWPHPGPAPGTSSDDGELTFARVSNDWHDITGEDEAFFLRVYGPGDFRFRAPIWASWSPRAGCRPRRASPRAAATTSTAFAIITDRSRCRIPPP